MSAKWSSLLMRITLQAELRMSDLNLLCTKFPPMCTITSGHMGVAACSSVSNAFSLKFPSTSDITSGNTNICPCSLSRAVSFRMSPRSYCPMSSVGSCALLITSMRVCGRGHVVDG